MNLYRLKMPKKLKFISWFLFISFYSEICIKKVLKVVLWIAILNYFMIVLVSRTIFVSWTLGSFIKDSREKFGILIAVFCPKSQSPQSGRPL